MHAKLMGLATAPVRIIQSAQHNGRNRKNCESQDMNGTTDTDRIKLQSVLDLAAAENFLETLRHQLQVSSRLRLDASDVETLTLPCIQIILAALRADASIVIEQPSNAFVSAFKDLGLDWSEAREPDPATEEVASVGDEINAVPDEKMEEASMAKRILTIDDSKTIRDMLKFTLLDAGFEVTQAVDGQDGVDMLGKERFDVVITDINMPKMDGYEVIRHMRSKSEHKSTPVLVLTTESEVGKRDLARQAGATGWMVKPFDPERLVATINKVAP
jgi:two-component system chemotaxis response regulator CheY